VNLSKLLFCRVSGRRTDFHFVWKRFEGGGAADADADAAIVAAARAP